MIGIIGAMDVEVDELKSLVRDGTTSNIAGTDFVCGFIEGVLVCVAQCGIGKVNAALCTQAMIDNFDIDAVINVGVGGSLSPDVVIKNVVIATDVCQHDMDITALGDPRGFIHGVNMIKMPTDEKLSEKLAQTAIRLGEKIHRGGVASGDQFISSREQKDFIINEFGAICCEMEGAAIGHVCTANGVPFAVVRSISDGGDEDAQIDYPTFKRIAAAVSAKIIIGFIKGEKEQIEFK